MAIQRRGSIHFDWLKQLKPISAGGEGAVFSAECFGQKVAVKILHRRNKQDDAQLLASLNHRNIVRFFGICELPPSQFILQCVAVVTEYCSATLYNLIHCDTLYSSKELLGWSCQIACGMSYLHSRNVSHRDLKSKNVLLDANGGIKICDFGMAKANSASEELMASVHGTILYMAPEVMREANYDRRVDLWSYGVVLWELITQRLPYDGRNSIALGVAHYKAVLPVPDDLPPELARLLIMCLQFDPIRRPKFDEIVSFISQLSPYEENQWMALKRMWQATKFSYEIVDFEETAIVPQVDLPPIVSSSTNSLQAKSHLLIYYGCFAECGDYHSDYREGRPVSCFQSSEMPSSYRIRSMADLEKHSLEDFSRFCLPKIPHWMIHCILELGRRRCSLQYPIAQQSRTAEGLLLRFLSAAQRPPNLRDESVDSINLCIYLFLHRLRSRQPAPQTAAVIREAVFDENEHFLRDCIQCLPTERRDLLALFMVHAHRIRGERNLVAISVSDDQRSREFSMLRKCLDVENGCCDADRLGRLLMKIEPGFWDECLLYGCSYIGHTPATV